MTSPLFSPATLEHLAQFIIGPHQEQPVLFYVSRYVDMLLRLDLVARPYEQDKGVRLTASPQLAITEALAARRYDDGFGIIVILDRRRLATKFKLIPDAGHDGDQCWHTDDLDLPLLPFVLSIVAITPSRAYRIKAHDPLVPADYLELDVTGVDRVDRPPNEPNGSAVTITNLIVALALRLARRN